MSGTHKCGICGIFAFDDAALTAESEDGLSMIYFCSPEHRDEWRSGRGATGYIVPEQPVSSGTSP